MTDHEYPQSKDEYIGCGLATLLAIFLAVFAIVTLAYVAGGAVWYWRHL